MITVFIRSVLLYAIIIVSLRLLGKRQIGELEPSELVVAVLISELAAIPMQDNRIPLIAGIIPVLTLMAMELLLSQATLQNAHIRKLLCGAPSVVIRDGAPVQSALKKNRLSIDEMLEVLRNNGITDIAEVRYAILETDGIVNVIPWADQRPVTVGRLGLQAEDFGLFTVFINDGRIMSDNLTLRGLDNTWLENEIKRNGADTAKDVFLLSADEALNVRFFAKEKR